MKNSQYLNDYLASNRQRGRGKGITIGTYLTYVLRGAAREYSGKYAVALANSLIRAGAVKGRSAGGRTAYYPADI